MTLTSAQAALQILERSHNGYQTLSNLQPSCNICGKQHFSHDHSQFLESMPQDPLDLVDDLVKMGIYKANQLRAADGINT